MLSIICVAQITSLPNACTRSSSSSSLVGGDSQQQRCEHVLMQQTVAAHNTGHGASRGLLHN
jgi:hypothetical protein